MRSPKLMKGGKFAKSARRTRLSFVHWATAQQGKAARTRGLELVEREARVPSQPRSRVYAASVLLYCFVDITLQRKPQWLLPKTIRIM
ncbi:hypothetical protein E2C01_024878 [Portunus trituberculatus]|uniref:Uncharacterized protein n=1 Tax=Portunus trituberculatus TaxID=210409 RepID=A0A5B7EF18_PORTR|nr:hypothetical protein [Portunus trituberculatus]